MISPQTYSTLTNSRSNTTSNSNMKIKIMADTKPYLSTDVVTVRSRNLPPAPV